MKNTTALKVLYLLVALVICVMPSIGLLLGAGEESSDSDAAAAPELTAKDGSFNVNVMADAGAWFEDHFAWRNEYVTASSFITSGLFMTSGNSNVVSGTDGWLYYGSTLPDYQATRDLSDRQLFDVAHSLALMQAYARENGANFVFAIAPNKNSLYDANMPYYYKGLRVGESCLERLVPYLCSEGVNYVNLHELFAAQDEVLYHARDSHWNNKGAALAASALLDAVGTAHADYSNRPYQTVADHEGDLDKMLFPSAPLAQDDQYYDPAPAFSYDAPVESNFDASIHTHADAAGKLLMYRDSFGSALLPFMAESFGASFFTRGVPYQLANHLADTQADAVVVERAERFISMMAGEPPSIPAPEIAENALDDAAFAPVDGVETLPAGEDYVLVSGPVGDADLPAEALLYVRIGGTVYEACGYMGDDGSERFQAMVPASVAQGSPDVSLCVRAGGK